MIKYIKYFFFHFEWETITKLSVYELRGLFSRHIESFEEYSQKGKKKHRQFVGEIKETGFEVIRFSSWRYSFARPLISGYFDTYDGGSTLSAKFKISFAHFAKSILSVLGLIAIQALLIYYFSKNPDDAYKFVSIILPFFLIGFLVMTFVNFWYEVLNSISIIQSIIKEECL